MADDGCKRIPRLGPTIPFGVCGVKLLIKVLMLFLKQIGRDTPRDIMYLPIIRRVWGLKKFAVTVKLPRFLVTRVLPSLRRQASRLPTSTTLSGAGKS
jgi:hypothetical protein